MKGSYSTVWQVRTIKTIKHAYKIIVL